MLSDQKTSHLSCLPGLLGYQPLRKLSVGSTTANINSNSINSVLLCREDASDRLVVLKQFSRCKIEAFKNESRALAALGKSGLAPELLFALTLPQTDDANDTAPAFALGIEYIPGKSLAEILATLDPKQKHGLGIALHKTMHDLHSLNGWTHGDLSPSNIMLRSSTSWSPVFVDWEFALKLRAEDLKATDTFRGTVGYTEWKLEPIERDCEAMRKLLRDFLELELAASTDALPEKKPSGLFAKLRGLR